MTSSTSSSLGSQAGDWAVAGLDEATRAAFEVAQAQKLEDETAVSNVVDLAAHRR